MTEIRKYTTPIQELIIDGIDLTDKEVYVTLSQREVTYTFEGEDLTLAYADGSTIISFHLTQETTAAFDESLVAVQVNWMDNGERNATSIECVKIKHNLLEEVLT